jgi:hypothetical protein
MKSLDEVIKNHKSECLDGRDMHRLMGFVPEDRLDDIGISLKEEYVGTHKAKPFTRENILKQLKDDVAFGFKKALNRRGLSADMMHSVVMMWNWVLEEGLEDFDEYPMYGLPLFKATAEKYGFPNPIGEDSGSESKYDG